MTGASYSPPSCPGPAEMLFPVDLIDRNQGQVQPAQLVQDAEQSSLIDHAPAEDRPVLAARMHFEALEPLRPGAIQLPAYANLVAAAKQRLICRGTSVTARFIFVLALLIICSVHVAS